MNENMYAWQKALDETKSKYYRGCWKIYSFLHWLLKYKIKWEIQWFIYRRINSYFKFRAHKATRRYLKLWTISKIATNTVKAEKNMNAWQERTWTHKKPIILGR